MATPPTKRLRPVYWKQWMKLFQYDRQHGQATWRWNLADLQASRKHYGQMVGMGTEELTMAVGEETQNVISRDLDLLLASWQAWADKANSSVPLMTLQSLTSAITEKLADFSASLPPEITSRLEPLGVTTPSVESSSSPSSRRASDVAVSGGTSAADLRSMRVMMERMLFVWCYLHPFSKYQTGMHEVLGMILQVLLEADAQVAVPQSEEVYPTGIVAQVLDPGFIEHDAFALFVRVHNYLKPLLQAEGGEAGENPDADGSQHYLSNLCSFIQHELLLRFDPFLRDQLEEAIRMDPATYLGPLLCTLFAVLLPRTDVALLWDHAMQDLLTRQPSSVDWFYEPPLFVYMVLAFLISVSGAIYQYDGTGDFREVLYAAAGGDSGIASSIVTLSLCMASPTHLATTAGDVDVVKFEEGPLGIVLQQVEDHLIVHKFQTYPGGRLGQAEQSGFVHMFDTVLAVNGVRIAGKYSTPQQFVELLRRVGRPVYVAFQRNEVLLRPDGSLNLPDGWQAPLLAGEKYVNAMQADTTQCCLQRHGTTCVTFEMCPGYMILTNYRLLLHSLLKQQQQPPPGAPRPSPREGSLSLGSSNGGDSELVGKDGPFVVAAGGGKRVVGEEDEIGTSLGGDSSTTSAAQPGGLSGKVYPEADWSVPVHTILKIESTSKGPSAGPSGAPSSTTPSTPQGETVVTVTCKDGQLRRFYVNQRLWKRLTDFVGQVIGMGQSEASFFAFDHYRALEASLGRAEASGRGMFKYSLLDEYQRIGLHEIEGLQRVNQWEAKPSFCHSYPEQLYVPAGMSRGELLRVCSYRSLNRIPVVVWADRNTRVTLARSSQPLVGLQQNRCTEDEKLIYRLRSLSGRDKYYIIDARGKMASHGNRFIGKGGGSELTKFYSGVEMLHMNISNVHAARESEQGLHQLCRAQASAPSNFLEKLDGTGWLQHLQSVLSAAVQVVQLLVTQRYSVLVHCSDGWDRTSQITSIAQLLIDPYYRTLQGFQVLVEKEWLDFGHQFSARCGHATLNMSDDQRSPIFVVFLDCIWQLTRQFPSAFEFNEAFLIVLLDNLYSCRFGTFLKNNCRERRIDQIGDRTASVWRFISEKVVMFTNAQYDPYPGVLYPSITGKNIVLWSNYHARRDWSLVPWRPATEYHSTLG